MTRKKQEDDEFCKLFELAVDAYWDNWKRSRNVLKEVEEEEEVEKLEEVELEEVEKMKAVEKFPKTLNLQSKGICDQSLRNFIHLNQEMKFLKVLKLFKNNIGDVGASQLANFIEKFPALEEVHLSHNKLSEKGAWEIVKACSKTRNSCFHHVCAMWLRLEYNEIDDVAIVYEGLKRNFSVCLCEECTKQHCNNGSEIHLPFFMSQKWRSTKHDDTKATKLTNYGWKSAECSTGSKSEWSTSWKSKWKSTSWKSEWTNYGWKSTKLNKYDDGWKSEWKPILKSTESTKYGHEWKPSLKF